MNERSHLKPGSGESAASLLAWCQEAMTAYKVEDLPMTANGTGKVKKNELERRL
ncbi:MAG: hypothetical protein V4812_02930 [Pseudomonadota bacterium]